MNRAQALVSVQAFLPEDKEIVRIIKGCSLEPVNGWRVWQNSASPYLKILKNRRAVVRYKQGVESDASDVLAQARPESVFASCRVALCTFQQATNVLLWCADSRFRLLTYEDRWLLPKPPLSVGLESLRMLVKHLQIQKSKRIDEKTFVTTWPPEQTNKELCNLANSLHRESSST